MGEQLQKTQQVPQIVAFFFLRVVLFSGGPSEVPPAPEGHTSAGIHVFARHYVPRRFKVTAIV